MFKLVSHYRPTGDQPEAIKKLVKGVNLGVKDQVLLGVTGSGKTYTMANVIEKTQLPTLVISPNKTLAGQLYQEYRDFFPENAVSYFVSYYDYYQPEAYIPQTDTYIEKEAEINEEIDKLRLDTTTNLATRNDVIVVASVSCIYNLGSPQNYKTNVINLDQGASISRKNFLGSLIAVHYQRHDYDFKRGNFRVRDNLIDIFPASGDSAIRVLIKQDRIEAINQLEPVSGKTLKKLASWTIYPAKHYLTDPKQYNAIFDEIRQELKEKVSQLEKQNKKIEAYRLAQRTEYDLQMIEEIGYVNGIENYSRYFDGRKPGQPPYCLIDHFPKEFLLIVDESHLTIPQIRGMYRGDLTRKKTLIDNGFRLPSALDNRPLQFTEFLNKLDKVIYTSATPADWELNRSNQAAIKYKLPGTIEQLIRPTGLVEPGIEIRPSSGQIKDIVDEIKIRISQRERTLVTTLTKRTAEELADYLKKQQIKTHYLHSDINTLERAEILESLRRGHYEVIVGINLLREGLDLPEVSLIAILDSDKEGFLRSETSLIQTMGRATRHLNSSVIMYADKTTGSMRRAIEEVQRRRQIQLDYNSQYGIVQKSIIKPIRPEIIKRTKLTKKSRGLSSSTIDYLNNLDIWQLTPVERKALIKKLRLAMKSAVRDLDFESAVILRDKAREVEDKLYG